MIDGWHNSDMTYEHPDLGDDDQIDPYITADVTLTAKIQAVIERHYPGHPWMIRVSHAEGAVYISIPLFMGMTNKYFIPISEINKDVQMRIVVKFCGEILERYNIPRHKFDRDHFLDALGKIPKELRGTHGYIPR